VERVTDFAIGRNNPNKTAISNLSPWLHYGQISPQRALLIIAKLRPKFKDACDSFIEEAFVRRELGDNYCYYQENCKFKKKNLVLLDIYFQMIILMVRGNGHEKL
jgi:deoxyribodipyrimidine photo-lyase